ncbi:serine-rich adhesin for platelets-like [Emydura macquarii macquarii]|uniref:serine-rich adhesin for platelets-like n=1 Tax=Emydura macquarii macquarii TaxID=1129001 RepID=UPI00352A2E0B
MRISLGILESTQMLSTKFQGLPVKQMSQNRKIFPTQRNTWKESVCFRRGQKQVVQTNVPIHREYKIPKLPPPSLASSEEDVADAVIHPHSPSVRSQETPLTQTVGIEEKKKEPGEPQLLWSSTETDQDTELDEIDKLRNTVSPLLSETEHTPIDFSRSTSSIRSKETSFSFERETDWSDFSRKLSSATVSREGSTPQSQSCSLSMSSMASSDAEPEAGSSQISNQPILHTGSLLVASGYCSDILSPSLNSSSCHGTADILQASSYSVKKCSGQTPSFLEIWHDRLLHHWPVLPPISPQRACLDSTCNVGSQASKLSSGTQDAFSELEGINPRTDCSLSQHNEGDSSDEDASDISELSKRAASLSIGCVREDESLAEIRLSLLDHQSWKKTDHDEDIQNDVEEWSNASEDISGYKMKNIIGSAALDANGFLLHPAPVFLKENKTPDTYSNNGIADQQSIYTMTVGMKSPNTLKNEDNSLSTTELHPNKDSRKKSSIAGASLVKDCCSLPQLTGLNETVSMLESGDALFIEHMHKVQDDTVLKEPVEDSHKDMNGCCIGDERPGDSRRPIHANRGRHSKMDTSILQGGEQQRKAEGRHAQALHIYSKLQETQVPAFRAPETRTISNFEDFDFLAKYCIFSQEKLAQYKRAFEAVDTDRDGYLNCLQVLMALKEIVPSDALTDAEELYVYRILEIVDYYVTDGLTDLRLFAVMASLAQKIAALDNFMRSLIGCMDFKALELKMYNARQLFLWNIDSQSSSITVDQLLVELKAGGISEEHEKAVQRELQHIQKLDLLDFLTYLPLFILIHNSVIANPLDDSRTI